MRFHLSRFLVLFSSNRNQSIRPSGLRLAGIAILVVCLGSLRAPAGEYHDLGRPVIGAWRSTARVIWDPVLEKDLLWSQECSQDGAVLFTTDLETGDVQIAIENGVPRSTARDWSRAPTADVLSLDVISSSAPELQQEVPFATSTECMAVIDNFSRRILSWRVSETRWVTGISSLGQPACLVAAIPMNQSRTTKNATVEVKPL